MLGGVDCTEISAGRLIFSGLSTARTHSIRCTSAAGEWRRRERLHALPVRSEEASEGTRGVEGTKHFSGGWHEKLGNSYVTPNPNFKNIVRAAPTNSPSMPRRRQITRENNPQQLSFFLIYLEVSRFVGGGNNNINSGLNTTPPPLVWLRGR